MDRNGAERRDITGDAGDSDVDMNTDQQREVATHCVLGVTRSFRLTEISRPPAFSDPATLFWHQTNGGSSTLEQEL